MRTEQNGVRINSLIKAMKCITSVYDLANPTGIRVVKLLNSKRRFLHIKHKHCGRFMEIKYDGMSRIGTALELKILNQEVWREKMKKPLLIMIVTDGDVSSMKPHRLIISGL